MDELWAMFPTLLQLWWSTIKAIMRVLYSQKCCTQIHMSLHWYNNLSSRTYDLVSFFNSKLPLFIE